MEFCPSILRVPLISKMRPQKIDFNQNVVRRNSDREFFHSSFLMIAKSWLVW